MDCRNSSVSEFSRYESISIEKPKLITLGKCSRFYLLILGSGLSKFFCLVLLGKNSLTKDGIGLFGFCPTFNNFNFMQSIIGYFGYIIFGIIFLFFKDIKKVEINELVKKNFIIKRNMNDNTSNENNKYNIIKIILLGIAFVLYIEIKKVLYIEGFQFFNFLTVEIIFILHFMRKYFIMDFYLHHKVSIIFIILICTIYF